nr:putative ribonuclease H-like domain-containing protein [Tanacetum cinerariifolium]
MDHKVNVIRCDNGTEFKNREMNQFCEMKSILRQFSVAKTSQQNRVAERGNMTLIEATRTMLADFKFLTTFWTEAVNTACYVQNRVLVVKPHNKTPYELFHDSGPDWLFDIDALTRTMNYEPIVIQKSSHDDGSKPSSDDGKKVDEDPRKETECKDQKKKDNVNSTNNVNIVSSTVNATGTNEDNELPFDPNMHVLEDARIFNFLNNDEDVGIVAHMNNMDTTIQVSPIPTTRIHKDHPLDQVIGDLHSTTQTRMMSKNFKEHGFEFGFTEVKTASTPMKTQKPLLKDEDSKEVDVHMYMLMIGSLMYLTSSRPDIMFAMCAYDRYQVNPKVSHLHAVKRIFRFESVSKHSNDSLLARGNTLRSDEDRMKLNELMDLCTNLQTRVLDLVKTKTTQSNEFASLKRRVKKLEKKNRSRTHKLKRLYKIGLTARVESSEEESLEPGKLTTTATISKHQSQEKGKGIMTEEPVKHKKKDQIRLDEEVAKRLQAEFDEEERLAKERAQKEKEANIALIETWDDIQAKIDDDYQLAERL